MPAKREPYRPGDRVWARNARTWATVAKTMRDRGDVLRLLLDNDPDPADAAYTWWDVCIPRLKGTPSRVAHRMRQNNWRSGRRSAVNMQYGESRSSPTTGWELIQSDVISGLNTVRDRGGAARLIIADPPYNVGIDYGEGAAADRRPANRFVAWCRHWIAKCVECLTDDGSFWLIISDEFVAELVVTCKQLGLHQRNWIAWYETFGVNCRNKFNRTKRHVVYFVKNAKEFYFDRLPVTRPSDRQTKYGDKRANPCGNVWDDVWTIPRVAGTHGERIPEFPTQLPLWLVEPNVLCASASGDLVIDPFSGSGTTGVAAIRNGRRYVGIDISERFVSLANDRLEANSTAAEMAF